MKDINNYSVKNAIDFRSQAIAFSENETLGETLDNDLLLDIILRDRLLRTLKKEDAYPILFRKVGEIY